jgi:Dolichyl-phosphate-mannose-protein mannosyltransferase
MKCHISETGTTWTSLRLVPLVLIAAHLILVLVSSRLQFPTRNEVAHVPAGLSCWQTGTFGLYNVNPPLWRMIATLPTLLLSPKTENIPLPVRPGDRPEWQAADRFANDNPLDYFELVWSARLAGIIWSLVGGLLVLAWSTELYGRRSGLLGLTLWCFGPNILAHACLVTPDMAATVAGLAATYTFWHYCRTRTWTLAALAGGLLGAAQLTKFTMLLLYPTWLVILVAHVYLSRKEGCRGVHSFSHVIQIGLIALMSVVVLNAGYGFDRTFLPLGDLEFVSRFLAGSGDKAADGATEVPRGNRFRGTWAEAIRVPLPAEYLAGIDVQRRDFEDGLPSYLHGEWRHGGWWYYYLYALSIKVPIGTLVLTLWGLFATVFQRRRLRDRVADLTLWIFPAVLLIVSSAHTGFSHHLRYVLPIAPFAIIATSKLGIFLRPQRRLATVVLVSMVLFSVVSSLTVYPHSLSYFNELVGGPSHGWEHLVDSNIDWGQDLYFFKAWAERHPEACPVGLAYSNYVDYRLAGAEFEKVPLDPSVLAVATEVDETDRIGPLPGWFGLDVYNLLRQDGRYRYFRQLRPVARAGYSIYIYNVTRQQADEMRRQFGMPAIN